MSESVQRREPRHPRELHNLALQTRHKNASLSSSLAFQPT
jgi:hypothetical protein